MAFGWGRALGYGVLRGVRNPLIALIVGAGVANAEPVTIAALGDSLTAGYGLPRGDGFVPQLQAWLDARGADVTIVNAGVSGDTTAGGLSRIDWTLTPDVDGMIVALGGNDFLRGIDPAVSRANLDGILAKAQAAGVDVLLIGLLSGANYGPDYKAAFDAMYVELAAKYDVPLLDTFYRGQLDAAGSQARVRDYMQADGIHPNKQGVAANVAVIGPLVLELAQRAAR